MLKALSKYCIPGTSTNNGKGFSSGNKKCSYKKPNRSGIPVVAYIPVCNSSSGSFYSSVNVNVNTLTCISVL